MNPQFHNFQVTLNYEGEPGPTVTKLGLPKGPCFYAIKCEGELLYVGESPKGAGRVIDGLKAPKHRKIRGVLRTNHSGYKWRGKYRLKTLDVIVATVLGTNQLPVQEFRRAVEAEIVYTLRQRNGGWPTEQHEIHFCERLRRNTQVQKLTSVIAGRF